MNIWPAECDQSGVGGFIVEMPSSTRLQVAWRSGAPIEPTLDAAKSYAAELIVALQKRGLDGDISRTNWASATAAIQKVISDWNDKLKTQIYASGPSAGTLQ